MVRSVLLFSLLVTWLFAESFSLLTPKDKGLYKEESASVVVKVTEPGIDRIQVRTDRNARYDLLPKKGRDTYCQSVPLNLGENTISIIAYKGDQAMEEKRVSLYLLSPALKSYKYSPESFQSPAFHTEANEKRCIPCHTMESNEKKGFAFEDVTKSTCYACHKGYTSKKYAHAPAVNYLCSSCHDKALTPGSPLKHPVLEQTNKSCFVCHTKNKEEWNSRRFLHAPLEMGHCDRCHNPHATENLAFLRLPVNELCMGCHGEKRLPASERGNSKCPGNGTERCSACHNPHASDRPYFLTDTGMEAQ